MRLATLADVDAILSIHADANERPRALGMDMWAWARTPAGKQIVARRIDEGSFYLGEHLGEPVAIIRIAYEDVEIWGEAGADGRAGYLHSLAVVRKLAGQQIGKMLLHWAEPCVAEAGKEFLRLDCMAENPKLCAYYQRAGFSDRGIGHDEKYSWQRWERKIGDEWP
jgi:GNAT superfamily N-acetyltransferase